MTPDEGPFIPSLQTRPFGTPLRRFTGKLKDYVTEKRTGTEGGGGKEYMVIVFNFTDVEVIDSVEPYPFPIATINISYSTTTNTRWDAFASSIKKVLGLTPTLDDIVDKVQEWAYMSCKLRMLVDGEWKEVDQEAWQLVSVEGAEGEGSTNGDKITEHILDLIDGKTEQDFYQVFYQDEEVRKHPDLITAATERQLLKSLEDAGRISRDTEGIWHRKNADQTATETPPA